MTQSQRRLRLITAFLSVIACVVGWYSYFEYRKSQFLRDLHLVGFSTSMIGSPRAEQELAVQQRATELGIDLFAAYKSNLDTRVRIQLAWMLITNESSEYDRWANKNIHSVPWPEVRIWAVRRNEGSLSSDYRTKLLDLILMSPTSEAKLTAARWYHDQGRISESEDAYHAAMTNGLFWDALDAANQLLESERYHDAAVQHLLSTVRDSHDFIDRAAFTLLNLYELREEMEPLVVSCRNESKDGPNRKLLAYRLTDLVEKNLGDSKPKTLTP